jgi:RNA polymerase sigma-70 factor (ECF subfamily)
MEALHPHTGTAAGGLSAAGVALLMAAQQGQPDAFDGVVREYEQRVLRQCRRRGLNESDAADVAQEVFLKAYRSLHRYEHHNAFGTWLHRIAENAITDFWRKRGRALAVVQPVYQDSDGEDQEFAGSGLDPQAAFELAELSGAVAAAIADLAPILRNTLLLKEQEGLRYEQIAAQLGCSLGTVKSRVFRARRELAERLRPLL